MCADARAHICTHTKEKEKTLKSSLVRNKNALVYLLVEWVYKSKCTWLYNAVHFN